jgi:hypothetical protein
MRNPFSTQDYYLLTISDKKKLEHLAIYGTPASYILKNPELVLVFAIKIKEYQYQEFVKKQ